MGYEFQLEPTSTHYNIQLHPGAQQDFATGEEAGHLNQKSKWFCFKNTSCGSVVEETDVAQAYHKRGVWRRNFLPLGRFCKFLKKIPFYRFGITFRTI